MTGATEWDHLGDRERRSRIVQTIGLGFFISIPFAVPGLFFYLLLRLVFGLPRVAFVVAVLVTCAPFVGLNADFWPEVAVSIWRTRFGRSAKPKTD